MYRGADEGRVKTAKLIHRRIDYLLQGTGLAFIVRTLLLQALDDDDLRRTEFAQLRGQAFLHIGDEQVVTKHGHFFRQVWPDIQLGIGDYSSAYAGR